MLDTQFARFAAACAVVLAAGVRAPAQTGDTCGSPFQITELPFVSGYDSTQLTDGQFTGSCNPGTAYADAWYCWIAQSDGDALVTASTTLNAGIEIGVYLGNCATYDEVACASVLPVTTGGTLGEVTFSAKKGGTYLIQVAYPVSPVSRGVTDDVTVSLEFNGPAPGESCANYAIIGGVPFTAHYDPSAYTADGPAGSCNAGSATMEKDGWWAWVSPADGAATFEATTATSDGIVAVAYSGNCNALTPIACNQAPDTATINFAVTSGTTYYLQVGMANPVAASRGLPRFDVSLSGVFAPGATCYAANQIDDSSFETVFNPMPLSNVIGDSCNQTNVPLLDQGWFAWVAPVDGTITVKHVLLGEDMGGLNINVYTGNCSALQFVTCMETAVARDLTQTITELPVVGGSTYYFQISQVDPPLPSREADPGSILFGLALSLPEIPCPDAAFQKLLALDGYSNDEFGTAVDAAGEDLAIGAPFKNNSAGAGYVFHYDPVAEKWIETAKLLPVGGAGGDQAGKSISMDGDYVALGAPFNNVSRGVVYLFKRDAVDPSVFTQLLAIHSDDIAQNDTFGWAVDLQGDTLMVGANGDNSSKGAVYVFQRDMGGADNWGQVTKIVSTDINNADEFGYAISLDGDTLLVGSRLDDVPLFGTGSAYVFERNQGGADAWGQVMKINPPVASATAHFGAAVNLRGDLAIVGAPDDNTYGTQAGTAWLFGRDVGGPENWGFISEVVDPDPGAYDNFGKGVGVSGGGSVAFVGAPLADFTDGTSIPDTGAVYIYTQNTGGPDNWGFLVKTHALDKQEDQRYGTSLSVDMGRLLIGARLDSDKMQNRNGAAYVGPGGFDDCNEDGIVDICNILEGDLPDENGNFIPDECENLVCLVPPYQDFPPLNAIFVEQQTDRGGDEFDGKSVAIDSPFAAVGDPERTIFYDQRGDIYDYAGAVDLFLMYTDLVNPPAAALGAERGFYPFSIGWFPFGVLMSPNLESDAGFGFSLDMDLIGISSLRVLVGTPFQNYAYDEPWRSAIDEGVAYIFELPNYPPEIPRGYLYPPYQELQGDDTQDNDNFGWDVMLDGDQAIVGAPFHEQEIPKVGAGILVQDAGEAYIFNRFDFVAIPFERSLPGAVWFETGKLISDEPVDYEGLGFSVDLEGDLAVAGAPGQRVIDRGPPAPNPGHVYVFARPDNTAPSPGNIDEWDQIARLTGDDAIDGAGVGYDVAIEGDIIAAGAPFQADAPPVSRGYETPGAVYIFHHTEMRGDDNGGWVQVAKLTPPESDGYVEVFGWSVALRGDFLLVGAPGDSLAIFNPNRWYDENPGSVYVYKRGAEPSDWKLLGKLVDPQGFFLDFTAGSNALGYSVDLDGFNAISGAPYTYIGEVAQERGGIQTGAAFVFAPISDCQPNGTLDWCDLPYGDEIGPPFMGGDSNDENFNLEPDECEMPGACCFYDYSQPESRGARLTGCVEGTEFECSILFGVFKGPDTTCAETDCDVTGACCVSQILTTRGLQIGYVDFDGTEQGLVSYTNPAIDSYTGTGLGTNAAQVSSNGSSTWNSNTACWPMIRSGLMPNGFPMVDGIADSSVQAPMGGSVNAGDIFGFAGQAKTDGFFGASNTSDNTADQDTNVDFVFDISNFFSLGVNIDFAAQGNFETETTRDSNPYDIYHFQYSIDGGPFQPLFTPDADENAVGSYTMDSGTNSVPGTEWDDPLVLNAIQLNDNFTTFGIGIPGTGAQLTIRFVVNSDGSQEGFGFDNLTIYGVPTPVQCLELNELTCATLGGEYHGDDSICDDVNCYPVGACCLPLNGQQDRALAICVDTTEDQCTTFYMGTFAGEDTSCATYECLITGACCLGLSGTDREFQPVCAELTELDCQAQMGSFLGVGTTCAMSDCTQIGACCFGCTSGASPMPFTCMDGFTLEDCCLTEGQWAGPLTSCAMTPCASPDAGVGICRGDLDGDNDVDVFDFGIFAANFMSQDANHCTGDFDCDGDVDVFDFSIIASNFMCVGETLNFMQCCNPNATPTGACCLPATGCQTTTQADCESLQGTYHGDGQSCTAVMCPAGPGNDLCANAIGPLSVPSVTNGTTTGATVDPGDTCGTSINSPGVWYTVVGTGNTMTASLCTGTTYDSKISVFCGTCDPLVCVTGNDDFCGLQSEVSWCSQAGAEYLILVHGFGGATGDFELTLSDNGSPCKGGFLCDPAR